jgi:hypothetical protein
MSFETYKTYEPKLLKDVISKFKEVLDVFIDDDLGWFPMSPPESPLALALKIHGPPVCKIVIHVKLVSNSKDTHYAEYANYIFADGYAEGYIPTKYIEPCNNWLEFVHRQ